MTVLSRQIPFPPAGGVSWQPGQGPTWRGGGDGNPGWWHAKAVLAADPINARYMRQGAELPLGPVLATTRSSAHLLQNALGVIQSFGANILAAIIGVGAYVGGQKSSTLPHSEDFENAYWTKDTSNGTAAPSVTANYATAPDGTMTARRVQMTLPGDGEWARIARTGFATTAGNAERGVWLRASDASQVGKKISIYCGGVDPSLSVSGYFGITATLTADWQRILFRRMYGNSSNIEIAFGKHRDFRVDSSTGETFGLINAQTATDFLVWGQDFQQSDFPTPYIPAASAAATRYASDVTAVAVGGEPFAGFAANGLGAGLSLLAAVDLSHVGDGAVRPLAEFSDGTTSNRLRFYIDTDDKPAASVVAGGTTLATAKLASAVAAGRVVLAVNYDPANGLYLVRKTALEEASAPLAGLPSGLATMRFGSSVSGNYLNDFVEQVQVAKPLSRTEAKAWVQAA